MLSWSQRSIDRSTWLGAEVPCDSLTFRKGHGALRRNPVCGGVETGGDCLSGETGQAGKERCHIRKRSTDSLVDGYNGTKTKCLRFKLEHTKKKSHFPPSYPRVGACCLPVLTLVRILAVDWVLTQQYSPKLRLWTLPSERVGGSGGLQGSLLGQPEGILGLAQTGSTRHFYFVSSMINLICFRFWETVYTTR